MNHHYSWFIFINEILFFNHKIQLEKSAFEIHKLDFKFIKRNQINFQGQSVKLEKDEFPTEKG